MANGPNSKSPGSLKTHLEKLKRERLALDDLIKELKNPQYTRTPIATTTPEQPEKPENPNNLTLNTAIFSSQNPPVAKTEKQQKVESRATAVLFAQKNNLKAKKKELEKATKEHKIKQQTTSDIERNKANITSKKQQIKQTNDEISDLQHKMMNLSSMDSGKSQFEGLFHGATIPTNEQKKLISVEIKKLQEKIDLNSDKLNVIKEKINTELATYKKQAETIQSKINIKSLTLEENKQFRLITKLHKPKQLQNLEDIKKINETNANFQRKIEHKYKKLTQLDNELDKKNESMLEKLGMSFTAQENAKKIKEQIDKKQNALTILEQELKHLTSEHQNLKKETPTSRPR